MTLAKSAWGGVCTCPKMRSADVMMLAGVATVGALYTLVKIPESSREEREKGRKGREQCKKCRTFVFS